MGLAEDPDQGRVESERATGVEAEALTVACVGTKEIFRKKLEETYPSPLTSASGRFKYNGRTGAP